MNAKQFKEPMLAAAYLAAATTLSRVTEIDGVPIVFTSDFSNVGQQKLDVLIYETAKINYAAMRAAFIDNTVWPDPPVPVSPVEPTDMVSVLTEFAKTATAGSPAASLATQLIGELVQGVTRKVATTATASRTIAPPGSDLVPKP